MQRRIVFAALLFTIATIAACGAGRDGFQGTSSTDPTGPGFSPGNEEAAPPAARHGDPKTCEEAAAARTYVGCDYWPTVVANIVVPIFDYAVVVANAGDEPADVTVDGPNGVTRKVTVAPNHSEKIFLPWVEELKGATQTTQALCLPPSHPSSVVSKKGAYHLQSSRPVSVYQFNALEYKGVGGPPGKQWLPACVQQSACVGGNCLSYSNDASLLIPTTAMTGNYRVAGYHADVLQSPYLAVTATEDGTTVTVQVAKTVQKVVAGGGILETGPGGLVTVQLDRGDVAEIFSDAAQESDLSGSLVHADKPIQVISGHPCTHMPINASACDHLEETVLPAETLGRHYVVPVTSSPDGQAIGHVVRFYGNVDGTHLTYLPARPEHCPATLAAGQVVDCTPGDDAFLTSDFEVQADHEFGVGIFMLSATIADPTSDTMSQRGDPSQSTAVAVEQWRTKYVFLAPNDYDASYADIVAPKGAALKLDGTSPSASPTPIAGTAYVVYRQALSGSESHVLEASVPVGLQVMGFGAQTSYQYPGGLDLRTIAPPPPPPH